MRNIRFDERRRVSGNWLGRLGLIPAAVGLIVGLVFAVTSAVADERDVVGADVELAVDAVLPTDPVMPDDPDATADSLAESPDLAVGGPNGDAIEASADAGASSAGVPVAGVGAAGSEVGMAAEPVPTVAAGATFSDAVDPAGAAVELGPLAISGASTIQPIIAELAGRYRDRTGADLLISGGGSGRGISDVREGRSDVGMVSRSLRDAEKADLSYTTIGLDTLVFVVNSANPQTQITRDQITALYTRSQDWQQLNGFPWPVRLVSKEPGRSTLDLFEEFSGLTSPDRSNASPPLISRQATVIGSNLEALTLVGGARGAMGYVSLGTAVSLRDQGLPIRILALGGVVPSAATIQSGQYPIRRELNLVYRDRTPAIDALLATVQSVEGQAVIERAGFIPTGGR